MVFLTRNKTTAKNWGEKKIQRQEQDVHTPKQSGIIA